MSKCHQGIFESIFKETFSSSSLWITRWFFTRITFDIFVMITHFRYYFTFESTLFVLHSFEITTSLLFSQKEIITCLGIVKHWIKPVWLFHFYCKRNIMFTRAFYASIKVGTFTAILICFSSQHDNKFNIWKLKQSNLLMKS